jgi:phosphatidylglycerophosphate synthase
MKTAADLCTLLRVLLAPLFAWTLAVAEPPGIAPLLVCLMAMATDFADGRLARAGGSPGPRGRLFDHGADILFLLPGLAVLAGMDRVPIALPCAAAVAFALYGGDGWRRGGSLRTIDLAPSQSGKAAGIANYAVAVLAAGAFWIEGGRFDAMVYATALGAAALNVAAALERAQALLRPTLRARSA